MKLSLNAWQMIVCSNIIGSQKGDAATIRKAAKCLDALELSDDAKKEIGLRIAPSGNLAWDDSERRFEIEIKDKNAADYFRQIITAYSDWSPRDVKLVDDLLEQLGADA